MQKILCGPTTVLPFESARAIHKHLQVRADMAAITAKCAVNCRAGSWHWLYKKPNVELHIGPVGFGCLLQIQFSRSDYMHLQSYTHWNELDQCCKSLTVSLSVSVRYVWCVPGPSTPELAAVWTKHVVEVDVVQRTDRGTGVQRHAGFAEVCPTSCWPADWRTDYFVLAAVLRSLPVHTAVYITTTTYTGHLVT